MSFNPHANDEQCLRASKLLHRHVGPHFDHVRAVPSGCAENLIQAVNIVGSIFYPVMLGLFMVGFFLPWVGATAVFWGALAAQLLVIAIYSVSSDAEYQLPLV